MAWQHGEPTAQQARDAMQQPLHWQQHFVPWAQHASLASAAQQALAVLQQGGFFEQQSLAASPAVMVPANKRPSANTDPKKSFVNIDSFSSENWNCNPNAYRERRKPARRSISESKNWPLVTINSATHTVAGATLGQGPRRGTLCVGGWARVGRDGQGQPPSLLRSRESGLARLPFGESWHPASSSNEGEARRGFCHHGVARLVRSAGSTSASAVRTHSLRGHTVCNTILAEEPAWRS
jgi:hypothetical protein